MQAKAVLKIFLHLPRSSGLSSAHASAVLNDMSQEVYTFTWRTKPAQFCITLCDGDGGTDASQCREGESYSNSYMGRSKSLRVQGSPLLIGPPARMHVRPDRVESPMCRKARSLRKEVPSPSDFLRCPNTQTSV